jgi:putative peptidoglycan binding protein
VVLPKFTFAAGGSYGRPLSLALGSEGWGVWALQSALGCQRTGRFDQQTDDAVRHFQADHKAAVGPADGIAGPKTKHGLAVVNLRPHAKEANLLGGLGLGMVDGESNGQCDAQSPTYMRSDGKRADLGVIQVSTLLDDRPAVLQAIDVPHQLYRLCLDSGPTWLETRGMRPRHDGYLDFKWVKQQAERDLWAWWLACASHNAPSWADRWAERGPGAMTQNQLDHLTRYVRTKAVYSPKLLALR